MSPKLATVALIGCGAIAEYGHASALRTLSDQCRVVALADVDPRRTVVLGDYLGVDKPHRHPSVDALIGVHHAIDLAVVLLPPRHSAEAVRQLLDAGIRVLCEKPVDGHARTVREIDTTTPAGRFGVVHNYRYRSDVQQALAQLAAQAVGDVRFLRLERPDAGHFAGAGRDPDWRRAAPSSCLTDNAYHWIYLAEELAGATICAVTARLVSDDLAVLILDHIGGAITSVQAAWCAADAVPVLEVHGSAGSLRLTGDGGDCLNPAAPAGPPGDEYAPAYVAMYRDVLDAVAADRPFGASAADCARVLDILAAAEESAAVSRTIAVSHCTPTT